MFQENDVIDTKFLVKGVCSDTGGMGSLLFVCRNDDTHGTVHVLKYCKQNNEEVLERFRREVRLLRQFRGNSRVIQVLDSNLDHDPPYFVMPYYSDGDLTGIAQKLQTNLNVQETLFNQMIDCISELHAQNVYHRDIKPQNFLLDGESIVVSDLGLSTEFESPTGFTRSSVYWGTPGYLPPEFFTPGGFKSANAAGDIFMLGKTFYFLLSGRDPTYLLPEGIPGPLFAVIERCCTINKTTRYQSLASFRQSLTAVYDVLLERVVGSALAIRTLRSIMDRLKASNQYQSQEIKKFIEELGMLDTQDKRQLCLELPHELFPVLTQETVQSHLTQFLVSYREMAENGTYGWSFAEIIADRMKIFFESRNVSLSDKAESLRIAVIAAFRQNRFAAMDTCRAMIMSVVDDELAQRVHDVMLEFPYSFIMSIEEVSCRASAIRNALIAYHKQQEDPVPGL